MAMLEGLLSKMEIDALKVSYQLGTLIDEERKDHPNWAKVHSLGIPLICLANEAVKAVVDTERMVALSCRSILKLKFDGGNVQSGAMHVCEHVRNIAGIVAGIPLALWSPKIARQTFLTVPAKKLQAKFNPQEAANLYSLGYALHEFCKRHGINYRICSGSVLGLEREGGIITHDDDIDTMLWPQHNDKMRALLEDGTFTRETGIHYKWQPFTGGWQIFHPHSKKGEGHFEGIGFPFIDIFCTKLNDTRDRIIYDLDKMNALSSGDYFTYEEWLDSSEKDFGPIKVMSPNKPLAYLHRSYGPDCMDFAYQTMHHDELAKMVKHPFDLKGHYEKIQRFGFPRRTLIVDKSPIPFDIDTFKADCEKINGTLNNK